MHTSPPVRVLVLCSHNRTRSVMAAGLLSSMVGNLVEVSSAGFGPAGLPPTPESVRLLTSVGVDASRHRSRLLTAAMVTDSDVVLCAERQHVMAVVANFGGHFQRTFTLPEYADGAGATAARPSGMAYLHGVVPEVDDPTGRSASTWQRTWSDLTRWCAAAASRLTT